MIDFDGFIFQKLHIPQEYNEQERFFKNLEQTWIEEIRNSTKAKTYFESLNVCNADDFIKSYVQAKIRIVKSYENYNYEYSKKEENELGYHKKAETALHAILQKKLFNLQLQWRACQKQIDDIDICYDFMFWENHIASCPYIAPIEEHEKELMKEYLLKINGYDEEITEYPYPSWQSYNELMEKDEDGLPQDMNSWYEFYDGRMGTGTLLNLPDLKGGKEYFYMQLNRNQKTDNTQSAPKIDTRSYLIGYGQAVIDFAKVYESDKYFIQLFKGYEAKYNRDARFPTPDDIELAVEALLLADRQVHVPAHLNWDEAIVFAARKYSNIKTAEVLDIVYDEYRMRQELGMVASETPKEIAKAYQDDPIIQIYKTAILKGRVKNGESADFNY